MLEKFLTVDSYASAEIVEKKSKFIAEIFYVENENEVEEALNKVRKEHRESKHNVYSYRIANGAERASDDKEPSGTAGVPILDILRGLKLQNVLVVVTRYFGGILLGTGGLVKAYTDATKEALKNTSIVEKILQKEYKVEIPYSYNEIILYFCKNNDYKVVDAKYDEKVSLYIAVKTEKSAEFENAINDLSGRNAKFSIEKDKFYD